MAGNPKSHLGKRAREQQADVRSQFVPAAPTAAHRHTGTLAGQQSRSQDADAPAHKDSNKTAPGSADKLFRCGQCGKAYSRVDHLSRHVRSHTQERPFSCRQCEKTFSRADLLKRHMTLHDPVVSRTGGQSTAPQENRVSQACEECARLHIKCADEKPCRRCEARGVACVYPNVATTATASSGAEAVAAHDLLSLAASSHFQHQPAQPEQVPGQVLPERCAMPAVDVSKTLQHHQMGPLYQGNPMTGAVMAEETPSYWEVPAAPEERIHDFLRAVMMGQDNMGGDGLLLSGTRTPRNMFDFGNEAEDWSLNDMDMMYIDDYSHHIPFLVASETAPSTGPAAYSDTNDDAEPVQQEQPPRSLPPTGVDATRNWRFRPVTKDSSDANLSVPVTTESHKRSRYHDRRVLSEPLSNSARDSILTLVATAGFQDLRPVASFPSTELLDSLLQFFLSTTVATSYICHAPTFSPNRRPILTLAMIAAGAALTPDAPLQKLGLVFQEAVRVTLPVMIERDNTLIRDVEILQTAYINLKHGFWSGNSRKMEVAESFMGPWATMVRRAGWFSRSRYDMVVPGPDDDGDVLQEKWKQWISQESWKRLVLFIIEHDTQVSLMLSINPNISYAELHFPLPYHAELWHAGSAQAWKTAFLSNPSYSSSPPPSVLDLLKNVDGLATPSPSFDVHTASQGLLCAAWGLVHEYRQLSGFVSSSSGPNQWHHGSLLLSSRLAELKRLLECIRLGSSGPNDARSLFLLEALSMHLHLSLDHVHLFAGVEGYQEAQRAFPILKAWVRTPTARQAIWHAGQILRLAKESTQTVRDFVVVLVYQATLALWSFGIISGVAPAVAGNGLRPEDHQSTLLTGRDSLEVSRFISLGRGNPAVSGLAEDHEQQPVVLLSDVGRVMHMVKRLLSVKGEQDGRTTPKLVENIIDLVEELRRAVSV